MNPSIMSHVAWIHPKPTTLYTRKYPQDSAFLHYSAQVASLTKPYV